MSLHDPHHAKPAPACPLFDGIESTEDMDEPAALLDDLGPTGPQARASDPETSHEAAAWLEGSGEGSRQRKAVLAAVRQTPGLTSDEIAASLHADRHMPGRRCSELERAGLIRRGPPKPSFLTGRRGVTWFPKEPR
jgi:hypothetical protein